MAVLVATYAVMCVSAVAVPSWGGEAAQAPKFNRTLDQWCIAKNGGGYTQRGMAKGLKVPCLFTITEVSIRCQKNSGGWYTPYTRVYPQYTTALDTLCGQLILRKISKLGATRCKILRLKCTEFDFPAAPPQSLPRSPRPSSCI